MGNVAFDFDGTKVDYIGAYLEWHNLLHGTNFNYNSITSNNFWKDLGITEERCFELIDEFYYSNAHEKIVPLQGAVELSERLKGNGDKLYIVTARPKSMIGKTVSLIEKEFGVNTYEDIIFTNWERKSPVLDKLRADYFVDDDPSHVRDCLKEGRRVYIYHQPWNKDVVIPGAVRIKSWKS